ncbi:hypothetical protein D918_05305 [Trichuris suis]|nr:hypothetical protein D918_05305 [Trichuris suis]
MKRCYGGANSVRFDFVRFFEGDEFGSMKAISFGARSYVKSGFSVFSSINFLLRKPSAREHYPEFFWQQVSAENVIEEWRNFRVLPFVPKTLEVPSPSRSFPIVGPPRGFIDILAPCFGAAEIPALLPSPVESHYKRYAHRMIRIRRRKIKKHWRLKRFRKRRAIYLRVHAEKKQRAEKFFLAKINTILHKGLQFNAERYVHDVIERAKWKPNEERLPNGRIKLPHWTSLVSIEELYGVKQTDYIDKRSCMASPEEWSEILKLKCKYQNTFGQLVKK